MSCNADGQLGYVVVLWCYLKIFHKDWNKKKTIENNQCICAFVNIIWILYFFFLSSFPPLHLKSLLHIKYIFSSYKFLILFLWRKYYKYSYFLTCKLCTSAMYRYLRIKQLMFHARYSNAGVCRCGEAGLTGCYWTVQDHWSQKMRVKWGSSLCAFVVLSSENHQLASLGNMSWVSCHGMDLVYMATMHGNWTATPYTIKQITIRVWDT